MAFIKTHKIVLILLINILCLFYVKCGILKHFDCKTEPQVIFDTIPENGER